MPLIRARLHRGPQPADVESGSDRRARQALLRGAHAGRTPRQFRHGRRMVGRHAHQRPRLRRPPAPPAETEMGGWVRALAGCHDPREGLFRRAPRVLFPGRWPPHPRQHSGLHDQRRGHRGLHPQCPGGPAKGAGHAVVLHHAQRSTRSPITGPASRPAASSRTGT